MERLETILLRLTKEEKEKIKEDAKRTGLTMSGYIRYQLLLKGGN